LNPPVELPGKNSKSAIIEEILRGFRQRLAAQNNTILQDSDTVRELTRQAISILEDVLGRPDPFAAATMAPAGEERDFSIDGGTYRARSEIHPIESLRAASALFDVALPIIVSRHGLDARRALTMSLTLHEALMERIALASLSYVDLLLAKLHASREDERRRISRELHDRVGHGMALTLQRLDLHKRFAGDDTERAQREFGAAVSSLRETLHTVRQLSAELRRSVGKNGLKDALEEYLWANVPSEIHADLVVAGDVDALPPRICEELYLTLREATRNALRHAHPTELRLAVAVTESSVTASITDNGCGFDLAAIGAAPAGGLSTMTERVELLHGTLDLNSEIGTGTTVTLSIPLFASGDI
jgi:signal transduction histidine kinase